MSNISLKGKFALVSGASRGIGKAIAIELARQGVSVALLGKTEQSHASLEGTLLETAEEIKKLGGQSLPIRCDVRSEEDVLHAISEVTQKFGRLDFLINNAGSVQLLNTEQMETKRFDLIQQINVRGAFLLVKHALPLLKKGQNAHILNVSPPLDIAPQWFENHLPYTLSKYSLSLLSYGWAAEFKKYKICVNSLWPRTLIDTAAMRLFEGVEVNTDCRSPQIMADASTLLFKTQESGQWFLDEDILREHGMDDFAKYATPGATPKLDLYVSE